MPHEQMFSSPASAFHVPLVAFAHRVTNDLRDFAYCFMEPKRTQRKGFALGAKLVLALCLRQVT